MYVIKNSVSIVVMWHMMELLVMLFEFVNRNVQNSNPGKQQPLLKIVHFVLILLKKMVAVLICHANTVVMNFAGLVAYLIIVKLNQEM